MNHFSTVLRTLSQANANRNGKLSDIAHLKWYGEQLHVDCTMLAMHFMKRNQQFSAHKHTHKFKFMCIVHIDAGHFVYNDLFIADAVASSPAHLWKCSSGSERFVCALFLFNSNCLIRKQVEREAILVDCFMTDGSKRVSLS